MRSVTLFRKAEEWARERERPVSVENRSCFHLTFNMKRHTASVFWEPFSISHFYSCDPPPTWQKNSPNPDSDAISPFPLPHITVSLPPSWPYSSLSLPAPGPHHHSHPKCQDHKTKSLTSATCSPSSSQSAASRPPAAPHHPNPARQLFHPCLCSRNRRNPHPPPPPFGERPPTTPAARVRSPPRTAALTPFGPRRGGAHALHPPQTALLLLPTTPTPPLHRPPPTLRPRRMRLAPSHAPTQPTYRPAGLPAPVRPLLPASPATRRTLAQSARPLSPSAAS